MTTDPASLHALRARLDRCAAAIDEALASLPADAGDAPAPRPAEATRIHFSLGGDRFAIDRAVLADARRPADALRLPGSAPACLGLVECAGELVPLFDIRALLVDGAAPAEHVATQVVGVGDDGVVLALAATAVIAPPPPADDRTTYAPPWPLPAGTADLVRGVTADGTVVLDAERLLHHPHLRAAGPEAHARWGGE